MRESTLHLKNVLKKYGGRTVVDVKDITFGNYGIEGLIGPNGAGKTTLIGLISHKVSMDQGQILYYKGNVELDISNKKLDEISRLGLVRTNQIIQDFQSLSIRDSLLLSLASSKDEKFYNIFSEKELKKSTEKEAKRNYSTLYVV
jgi:ABC-type branched-subunit amino acid transport system ATPase component